MNRTQKLLLWATLFLWISQILVAATDTDFWRVVQYLVFVLAAVFLSQAFYVSGRAKR